MATLLGVEHNLFMYEDNYFKSVIKDLLNRSHKKNGKIGIEFMPLEDWEEVKKDLERKTIDLKTVHSPDINFYDFRLRYDKKTEEFWRTTLNLAKEIENKIVFLDDKQDFFEYNSIQVNILNLLMEKQEKTNFNDDLDYWNFAKNWWESRLSLEEFHKKKRNRNLLEKIEENNIDLAIVGIGHFYSFLLKEEKTLRKLFSEYIDAFDLDYGHYKLHSLEKLFSLKDKLDVEKQDVFQRNKISVLLSENNIVERAINFRDNGSLTDKKPDYVGTWMIDDPFVGYFEMFIEEQKNQNIKGTILDHLGVSSFEGNLDKTSISFDKKYLFNKSVLEAASDKILYKGNKKNGIYEGGYHKIGFPFFLIPVKENAKKSFEILRENRYIIEGIKYCGEPSTPLNFFRFR